MMMTMDGGGAKTETPLELPGGKTMPPLLARPPKCSYV